ncbi:zf-HC2 domain-containing protein [Streptomyces goshikiensis]|uniref:Zf-HC2 domain-containing protein n=1 Tax=Streptomyces goshikiensis TaxID=1942 RepID=A0ABZ1RNF7_9ACTN|nr:MULTISPECIES: maleylpyruvate isomerase N-terminal domain-containing protein [Streptomyces]MBP0934853.1 maleylpyruvate isomerase N-terminal domain-containing protein [Streptomyces sp. KCTC 0041BP]
MTGPSGAPGDGYDDGCGDGYGLPGGGTRIPGPRGAADDLDPRYAPDAPPVAAPTPTPTHGVLKSLLGAWALAACSAEETQAVEDHLTECAPCAEEALRLRDAVGLLHPADSLDLKPMLRSRVLEDCLGKRPARIPVPAWATPYDTETARLDALLQDFGDAEWHTPVRLKWFEGERGRSHRTTVAGVIGHLLTVDGMVATALGLDDPLGPDAPQGNPSKRTEFFWGGSDRPVTRQVREPWREQGHTLVRTVSFAGRGVAELSVDYGPFALPLGDAFLERAFECWVHAWDIAEAVDYPYDPPSGPDMHRMIDLAARLLPGALAHRRRSGLAAPPRGLVAAGAPGRTLHLEIEGSGGGSWDIALDSPAAKPSPEHRVAHIALDGGEFCQLAAGHISPEEAAIGQQGDREAIRDVLFTAASLSRL